MTHLNSFTDIVDNAITDMIAECEYNHELKLAILSTKKDNDITVGDYVIRKTQVLIWDSLKNFYNIYYSNGELLFENICSTHILIKLILRLLNNEIISKNDSLIVMDTKYSGTLADALYYKQRLYQHDGKDDITKSIYAAKFDVSVKTLERIKDQIQKNS